MRPCPAVVRLSVRDICRELSVSESAIVAPWPQQITPTLLKAPVVGELSQKTRRLVQLPELHKSRLSRHFGFVVAAKTAMLAMTTKKEPVASSVPTVLFFSAVAAAAKLTSQVTTTQSFRATLSEHRLQKTHSVFNHLRRYSPGGPSPRLSSRT